MGVTIHLVNQPSL